MSPSPGTLSPAGSRSLPASVPCPAFPAPPVSGHSEKQPSLGWRSWHGVLQGGSAARPARRATIPFSPSPFPQPSQIPLLGTPKSAVTPSPAHHEQGWPDLTELYSRLNLQPQNRCQSRQISTCSSSTSLYSTPLSCCPGAPLEPLPDLPGAVPSCGAALFSKDRKQTSPKQSLGRHQRCCLSCSSAGTAVNHGGRAALPARARQRAWAELCAANGGSKGFQERLLGSLCLWGGPAELVLSPALPPAARIREAV